MAVRTQGVYVLRLLTIMFVWCLISAGAADACTYTRGPFLRMLDKWSQTCGHPLCGSILRTGPAFTPKDDPTCASDAWVALREDIKTAAVDGGAVLLGEVHDNPLHHELRSRIALATFASVVMEQISADQRNGLDAIKTVDERGYNDQSLGEVLKSLDWSNSGWSKYDYSPLLRSVLLSRRAVYAGDPDRELIKKVVRDGKAALGEPEVAELVLDKPLGEGLDLASITEIAQAHCGAKIDTASLSNMAFAQRYRDAHMADAVVKAIAKHGSAVLFAGNAHVRNDRGVPWYLGMRAPQKKNVSVMLIEVEADKKDASAYVPRDPGGKPAVDYIIFTPRAERPEMCHQHIEK